LTQINQQDVDHGEDLAQALQKLEQAYVPGRTYWVGYGDADRDVLTQVCMKYKIPNPFPSEEYIDLASQFKLFYAKERRLSLKNAVREVGLELDGIEHTAMDDAKNAAQLLLKMIQDGWVPKRGSNTRSNLKYPALRLRSV
jgi:sporulation inhibitor KapD